MFKLWESSLSDLHQSAVAAFPHTTMRQHATDPIQITSFSWVPFLGMRTLFLKVRAQNEDRVYNPIILFKDVNYTPDADAVQFTAADNGKEYTCKKLSLDTTNVLVRCNCNDYFWRFIHTNHLERSNYGHDRKPYIAHTDRGPINPTQSPGICKHLMKTVEMLEEMGFVI